jgi:hypothetical protein
MNLSEFDCSQGKVHLGHITNYAANNLQNATTTEADTPWVDVVPGTLIAAAYGQVCPK